MIYDEEPVLLGNRSHAVCTILPIQYTYLLSHAWAMQQVVMKLENAGVGHYTDI